jgi:7-carboxy-7-deazaguanine synthase
MIKVNEIYHSIQGESKFAGLPCVFIRLTYCNLRCTYCDTEYAFYEGADMNIEEILDKAASYHCKLVEITGGEPLMQEESIDLIKRLCDQGYTILLETGGSLPIAGVDKRAHIIMDWKCPSSGMMKKNRLENIHSLKRTDEMKFVIGDREDYEWSRSIISEYELNTKCDILFSCVFNVLKPAELVSWIQTDNLPVRFQLQLHKYIWDPLDRGV